MKTLLLALASISLSVAAQFAMKHGAVAQAPADGSILENTISMILRPWVLVGLMLYAIGAVAWLSVLQRWEVSKAYPLVGLGFVFTTVIGACMGDAVTVARVTGVVMIAVGVYIVAAS